MKTAYVNYSANIVVDKDTEEISNLKGCYSGIKNVYIITEPMHIVYSAGEYKRELDAEEGDILITFYTANALNHQAIIVKNEDWYGNIQKYLKKEQEEKEKWAASKQCTNCCEAKCCDPEYI